MTDNMRVRVSLRHGFMYTWIDISVYEDALPGRAGHAVLKACVELLHPFLKVQQQFELQIDVKRTIDCQHVLNGMRDQAHVFDLELRFLRC